jgi:hypothetical protein
MITTTFIAACKYKGWRESVQMSQTVRRFDVGILVITETQEEEMDWKVLPSIVQSLSSLAGAGAAVSSWAVYRRNSA